MSFETAFEKWLGGHSVVAEGDDEEEPMSDTKQEEMEKAESELSSVDEDDGGGMPVIERMAWQEEDLKGMPVLQRMVDLPSKNGAQAARSPPPPPLQISLSLKRCSQEGKHSKKNKSGSHRYRVERSVPGMIDDGSGVQGNRGSQDSVEAQLGKNQQNKDHQQIKPKKREKHKKLSKSTHHKQPVLSDIKHSESSRAGVIPSPLTGMTALDSVYSPGPGGDATSHGHDKEGGPMLTDAEGEIGVDAVNGSEVKRTTVLSPDRGLVEPDSTSEISGSDSRTNSQQADSDVDTEKDSLSPLASGSMGCVHGGGSDVSVRVEEGLGECDSTSMFLTSPSAISPASQGEIEERICPVLTDHEEGSNHVSRWSPGHCICLCRSFPPPTDLISPTATTASTGSSDTKSGKSLVSDNGFCCEPAPRLEKMPTSHDPNLEPTLDNSHRETPPLLSLTGVENSLSSDTLKREDRMTKQHLDQACVLDSEHCETPPPLTRYETSTKVNCSETLPSPDVKYSESPPLLSLPENAVDRVHMVNVKREHPHDRGSKAGDFTPDIKWESAVATVETKPSPNRGSEGDCKPNIVIKIRTNGMNSSLLTVPEAEPTATTKPAQQPMRISQKRHTIDSPDMARRLRKHRKIVEEEKPDVSVRKEGGEEVKHSSGCSARGRRSRLGQNTTCPCCTHISPKHRRRRRNTVQLGGDLTTSVAHLPPNEQQFVLSSSRLSRLQTRAHTLVCTLFPRLASLLANVAPESRRFEKVIDDIIGSLQRSEQEENYKDSEELSRLLEKLSLGAGTGGDSVPVFSPQVVLCSSPHHSLEEFQEKLCRMLQLLLPDLTFSLSENLFRTSEELELMLDRVIIANKFKAAKKLL